jgi:hypothetical protein
VQVPPSTPEETLEILAGLKGHYEKHHNVRFSEDTLKFMVKQADRFIHTNVFPDKAIDLLDEAGAIVGARMDAAEIVEKAKLVEAHKAEFDLRLNLFYEGNQLCSVPVDFATRVTLSPALYPEHTIPAEAKLQLDLVYNGLLYSHSDGVGVTG